MTETFPVNEPIWCAGCGHFGVRGALVRALDALAIPSHDAVILAGIGCSGTIQSNVRAYGYHAMHGRVLPTATGVALANPELTVIATGGDGDGYAIGAGHFVHALKRNTNFLYIVMNNGTYGLTKGQDSPTASAADGLDAVRLALSVPGTGFIARGFARWSDQLYRLTLAALEHVRSRRGFAFLEILSPCVTYNDTYAAWEATLDDLDDDPDYDPTDRAGAFRRAVELGERGRMQTGLVFRAPDTAAADPVGTAPAHQDVEAADLAETYRSIMMSYTV